MKIEQWDTYIMNLADEHYRRIVVNKVKQQVIGKGIDGVFLDTAGDIDDYFMISQLHKEISRSICKFIKRNKRC